MKDKIDIAIGLRKGGKSEQALEVLLPLLKEHTRDPLLNYQIAWTYDFLGREREAVSHYEIALSDGLSGEDRRGALLGLGSTYRCLGSYDKSLAIFDKAIAEYPEFRAFKVFRALTLHNLGRFTDSTSQLLIELIETTSDSSIKSYSSALSFYSNKLNQVWK